MAFFYLDVFLEEQLIVMCMDLFLAGTETTASSLGYFFLYLMQHPEEQEKMRQEIFRVVGRDRLPSLDDMPKYTFRNYKCPRYCIF
jgi:cytochrome P450